LPFPKHHRFDGAILLLLPEFSGIKVNYTQAHSRHAAATFANYPGPNGRERVLITGDTAADNRMDFLWQAPRWKSEGGKWSLSLKVNSCGHNFRC
jgi:hypothetical protein